MIVPDNSVSLANDIHKAILDGGGNASITNVGSFFKTDANIKAFAKYKPVEHNAGFIDNKTNGEWWKSKDLTCQVSVNLADTLAKLEDQYLTGNTGWTYKPFVASTEYPWRLGDFRGYNSNAKSSVDSIEYADTVTVTTSGDAWLWLTVRYKNQDSTELKFSDIAYNYVGNTMDKWYVGFVYKTSKDSTLKIKTMPSAIAADTINETLTLKVNASDAGIFTLYPILSQNSYVDSATSIHPATYICPLPDASPIQIELKITVDYDIVLDSTTSFFQKANGLYQFNGVYNMINKGQVVEISGKWYYTPIDYEGLPNGPTIAEPKTAVYNHYITIDQGDTTGTYIGTALQFESTSEIAGFIAEFRSETTGASFGNQIFNITE